MRNVCILFAQNAHGNTVKNKQNHAKCSVFSTTKKRTFTAVEVAELGFLVDKTDSSICRKNPCFFDSFSLNLL